jgi:hypothetical protein
VRALAIFYRNPDFVIGKPDAPYMRRWYIIPRNRWFNIYLHNIVRSDDDRALHDHPWWNLSVVLKGGYWEVRPLDATDPSGVTISTWRSPGSLVLRRATAAHRLAIPTGGSCWSLFITGRKVREWGFWCPQGWKVWTSFVDMTNTGTIGPGCGERD